MRFLVFGGTGYIGNKLILKLIKLGFVIGNVSRRCSLIPSVINYNIRDDLKYIISEFNPDKIIYLSACFDNSNIDEIIDVNIKIPLDILKTLKGNSQVDFNYIGSYWQFGDQSYPNIPIDLYSASKKAIVSFFDYYNTYTSLTCNEIVLYGTYGESDGRGKILDLLINTSKNKTEIDLSPGMQVLNLSNVEDVCEKIIKITLHNCYRKNIIKSDKDYTLVDIIDIISSISEVKVNIGSKKYREVELMNSVDNVDYVYHIIPDNISSYIKMRFNEESHFEND